MKTEIVPFEDWHALEILAKGEISISPNIDKSELLQAWREGGPSYTLFIDDEIICCGGIFDFRWNRGEAWTLVSPAFYKHKKTAFREIKYRIDKMALQYGFKRIQSTISFDAPWGFSWMDHLGFEYEGLLKAYGPNGEDMDIFAKVYR